MSDQTPSIGRIVRYTDNRGAEFPAIITGVTADDVVSLHVFYPTNGFVPKTQADGETRNTWRWPQFVPPKSDPPAETARVRAPESET